MYFCAREEICVNGSPCSVQYDSERLRRAPLTIFYFLRDTEIRNLDVSLVIDEDVRSLDISMNDLSLVEVIETGEDLSNELADQCFFERSVIREESGDGSSGNVFEKNVKVLAVGRRIEVLHDVCRRALSQCSFSE